MLRAMASIFVFVEIESEIIFMPIMLFAMLYIYLKISSEFMPMLTILLEMPLAFALMVYILVEIESEFMLMPYALL